MASSDDIATVHRNIDEPTEADYTDAYIGTLIDAHGVAVASAMIWEQKAAKFVTDVTVSEAGASHSFSDLNKNALAMAKNFRTVAAGEDASIPTGSRTRVRKIVRS